MHNGYFSTDFTNLSDPSSRFDVTDFLFCFVKLDQTLRLWTQSSLHILQGSSDAFLHGTNRTRQEASPTQTQLHHIDDSNNLLGGVNLGDVGNEVQDTAGVSPLVVVPGDQLDEVVVQGDTGLGIEDGGGVVAVHVSGDNVVLSVSQNAWL